MSYFYAIALVPPEVVGLDRAALGKWYEDEWAVVSYLEETLMPFHLYKRRPLTMRGAVGIQYPPPQPYDLTRYASPDQHLHIFRIGGYFDGLIQGKQVMFRECVEGRDQAKGMWGTGLRHNTVPARELLVRYFDESARGVSVPGFPPEAIITPEPCWCAQDAAGRAAWEHRAVGLLFGYLHCMAVGLCCWYDKGSSLLTAAYHGAQGQRPYQPLTEGHLSPEAIILMKRDGIAIPNESKSTQPG